MRREDFAPDTDIVFDAAVVGAGFAGLSATEKLIESPLVKDVLLLEGRGQVGGRASDGPDGPRGAELVYSQPVINLARRHGLHVEMRPDEWEGSYILSAEGKFSKADSLGLFSGKHPHEVLESMKVDLCAQRNNISVEDFLSRGMSRTYNDLQECEQSFIRRLIEGEYAADLSDIGIASFQLNSDTFTSETVGRIPDGG